METTIKRYNSWSGNAETSVPTRSLKLSNVEPVEYLNERNSITSILGSISMNHNLKYISVQNLLLLLAAESEEILQNEKNMEKLFEQERWFASNQTLCSTPLELPSANFIYLL